MQTSPEPISLAEVQRLAAEYNVIPVTHTILADLDTPVAAYLNAVRGVSSRYSYLLESVEGGETIGRYSYVGVNPYLMLRQRGARIEAWRGEGWQRQEGTLLELARAEVKRRRIAPVPGSVPFMAGAVGYFGYDMVRTLERLPARAKNDLRLDDGLLMFFSRQIVFDHVRRQITLVACVFTEADIEAEYERARQDLEAMERRLRRAPRTPRQQPEDGPLDVQPNMQPRQYEQAVEQAKEYIRAGDAFQIVLSQRFDVKTGVHPFQVYRALRTVNPSPYMFYLQLADVAVVGASPEMLVQVTGNEIHYRPIAGTRPRGATETEDAALAEELLADDKERAEHIMLVDLGRNDVGRVSEIGAVQVTNLMYVEKYSHVMHLVSAVRGRLHPDRDMFDALAACFPAGTLSGAPKVRAMEIIEELEPTRRGIYAGSVMYLDFAGNLNACIAIRTMVMRRGVAHIQAGAGIVADSVPEREHQECVNKARAIMRAIERARAGL